MKKPLDSAKVRAAWAVLKDYCVEAEYVDSGSFQAGEEDCSMAGITTAARDGKSTCFVFNPDAVPWKDES